MTHFASQLKHGASQAWESLAEGWRELSQRASSALTRFRPGATVASTSSGGSAWPQAGRWGLMAADLFDDGDRLTVRIEAPGLNREDFHIDIADGVLSVWGEKRLDQTSQRGNYRLVQCAYGSFRRELALPAAVQTEQVRASYRDGVLRIDLPKRRAAEGRRIPVQGD